MMLPTLLLLAAASRAADTAASARPGPLQPLLSAVVEMPYLRTAMTAQLELTPWKTDEAAAFLELDGAKRAPASSTGVEARRVIAGLMARGEELEEHRSQLDGVLGESLSHGLILRAGLLGRDPDVSDQLEGARRRFDVSDSKHVWAMRDRFAALFDKALAKQSGEVVRDAREDFERRAEEPSALRRRPARVLPFAAVDKEQAQRESIAKALSAQAAAAPLIAVYREADVVIRRPEVFERQSRRETTLPPGAPPARVINISAPRARALSFSTDEAIEDAFAAQETRKRKDEPKKRPIKRKRVIDAAETFKTHGLRKPRGGPGTVFILPVIRVERYDGFHGS